MDTTVIIAVIICICAAFLVFYVISHKQVKEHYDNLPTEEKQTGGNYAQEKLKRSLADIISNKDRVICNNTLDSTNTILLPTYTNKIILANFYVYKHPNGFYIFDIGMYGGSDIAKDGTKYNLASEYLEQYDYNSRILGSPVNNLCYYYAFKIDTDALEQQDMQLCDNVYNAFVHVEELMRNVLIKYLIDNKFGDTIVRVSQKDIENLNQSSDIVSDGSNGTFFIPVEELVSIDGQSSKYIPKKPTDLMHTNIQYMMDEIHRRFVISLFASDYNIASIDINPLYLHAYGAVALLDKQVIKPTTMHGVNILGRLELPVFYNAHELFGTVSISNNPCDKSISIPGVFSDQKGLRSVCQLTVVPPTFTLTEQQVAQLSKYISGNSVNRGQTTPVIVEVDIGRFNVCPIGDEELVVMLHYGNDGKPIRVSLEQ